MNRMRALAGQDRRFAAWLLALALFARLLIPAGWMPSSDQGRWISICSGDGKAMAFVDQQGNPKPSAPAHGDQNMQHCVFAAVSLMDDLPEIAAALPLPPVAVAVPALRLMSVSVGQGLAAPPPPKTGPPILN